MRPEFANAVLSAIRAIREDHANYRSAFEEMLRREPSTVESWQKYQSDLVGNAVSLLGENIEIKYWCYFFDSHNTTEEFPGRVFFQKGDDESHELKFIRLWETRGGRLTLKKAEVPRLAELFYTEDANDAATNRDSHGLPWVFDFTGNSTVDSSAGRFVLSVPEEFKTLLKQHLPNRNITDDNCGEVFLDFLQRIGGDSDQQRGKAALLQSFGKSLKSCGKSNPESVAQNHISKLINYLAWLTASFAGELPAFGFYFPGTAGYSTLPDIGCAIGIDEKQLSDEGLQLISAFVDLSLYYSLQPFAPELEKAGRNRLQALRRAARAAVFARNFSHITGSHVISNPDFRSALVGDEVLESVRNQMDQARRDFIRAEEVYLRDGFETDPEHYWREGSVILDAARHELRTGGNLLANTRRFHEYLQGRFDFIARAIDETQDQPEPVSFVGDLLEGFLSQTAFLDTFVADVGLRLANMEFVVQLPLADNHKQHAEFKAWKDDAKTGEKELRWLSLSEEKADIRDHEVMIALPGGMVSVHAFYSLLENIIRNSAKYGKKKTELQEAGHPYRLMLKLERQSNAEHFILHIEDNFNVNTPPDDSFGSQITLGQHLGSLLKNDFIEADGSPRKQGLGMLEMQACAESLYRGDLPSKRERHLMVSDPNAGVPLVFTLPLNVPVLLGIVSKMENNASWKISRRFKCPEEAISKGAHLLLIDGSEADNRQTWLDQIKAHHPALPYRMLVVCSEAAQEASWRAVPGLPPRRLHVTTDDKLHQCLFVEEKGPPKPPDEENAIIAAYGAWLKAWKGVPPKGKAGHPENKWHLWIGLERSANQMEEAWKKSVEAFDSDLIQVGVRASQGGLSTKKPLYSKVTIEPFSDEKSEREYWEAEINAKRGDKRALVFDNHGNCFNQAHQVERAKDFAGATRFYQKLTGSHTPDLFRTLCHPPTSSFLFQFFIHSLVETCLTNVMIVDERLAWDLIAGGQSSTTANRNFREDLANHQKAGVFPVFSFKKSTPSDKPGDYSPKHGQLLRELIPSNGGNPDLVEEGLHFASDKDKEAKLSLIVPASTKASSAKDERGKFQLNPCNYDDFPCDVLIVHEGALDLVVKSGSVSWKKEEHAELLWKISPAVVRTSGRGRETGQLKKRFPFVEFGEVSSAVLTARNKFSLVRALLGAAGEKEEKRLS